MGEIKALERQLTEYLSSDILLCPLYGDLSKSQQDQALQPDADGRRRIILATSIAETSLTIEGITTVVDSGWSRQPRFNPDSGMTRLVTTRVSKASADQRAGRAGRLGPGVCYRLWTPAMQSQLVAHIPPEILAADLSVLALELAQWGVSDPGQLRWLNEPPKGAYAQASDLLGYLNAIDDNGRITHGGQLMLSLGTEPRLAHLMLVAAQHGQAQLGADIAALLSEKDILLRARDISKSVDLDERLQILTHWRNDKKQLDTQSVDLNACRQVDRTSQQFLRRLSAVTKQSTSSDNLSLGSLLAQGFPDRIARCRDRQRYSYQMVIGRRAVLPEADPLSNQDFIVVAHLDAGKSEGRVHLAASITLDEIREVADRQITQLDRVEWDSGIGGVVARREERLGQLVLSERELDRVNPESQLKAVLEGIRKEGLGRLPWDSEATEVRDRIRFLKSTMPDIGCPDVSDAALLDSLEEWLAPYLSGFSRREHLKRLDLKQILLSMLSWEQQVLLKEQVPTHFTVPSGSRKRIDYTTGELPVLAVRLQELFGSVDTPSICSGKVPLTLHLLSPAQRPIQVTQDLAGFWERTYPEVKKELKGRYPKHYWPDNPLIAEPTARAKPRGT